MRSSTRKLIDENLELKARLEAAEEALRAIQQGEVDALVIYTNEGEQIYTLEGADYAYRVMIENISEGVATLQHSGTVIYANQRLSQILGCPLETILGSNFQRFIKPEDLPEFEALLRNSTEGFSLGDLTVISSTGVEVPILVSLSGIERGGVQFTCGVFTDLTEQKAAQEIIASEKLALSVLEQSSEAILVCDLQGNIIRASRSAETLAGGNPLLKPFEEAFTLEIDRPEIKIGRKLISEVLAGKSFRGIEARLKVRNRSCDLFLSAAPLFNDRKHVKGCVISLTDISNLKEAERRADAERERFEITLASIADAVITTGPSREVTYLNPAAERLTGWTNAQAASLPVEKVMPVVDETTREPVPHPIAHVTGSDGYLHQSGKHASVTKSGEYYPIETSAAPILDPPGNIQGAVMVFRDVTERRKAQEFLKKYQERLLMTTEATEIGIWEWDLITNAITWDERCSTLYGVPFETLTYEQFQKIILPEDREATVQAIDRAFLDQSSYRVEFRIMRPDGEVRWIHSRGQVVAADQAGQPTQLIGISMDTTDHKLRESEIQSNLAQIEVQHRLIEQRELERQQIARDLHDGPVQDLIAVTYALHNLRSELTDPDLIAELVEIQSAISGQVNELRAYAGELRPPILSRFGLEKAIATHLQTFQEKHPELQVDLEVKSVGTKLSDEVRLALYRIYQEALNNIVKHSRASMVKIRVDKTENRLVLEVQDNGTGFEPARDWLQFARDGHLGLVGIRERAEAVNGRVNLNSKPGKGTHIRVEIPIQDSTAEAPPKRPA